MNSNHGPARTWRRGLAGGGALAAAALALAACGSSGSTGAASGSNSSASSSTSSSSGSTASSQAAAPTISTATVAGFGSVLVNGDGRTLYLLTSEKGGKITCTDDNGCTKIWPDTELPSGVTTAKTGAGIQASLLGTVKDSKGSLYVTYGGYPLYTFAGDSAPGQAKGEGITSFGGTWYVINASGQPVTSKS
ncbi:MAG TPA: hypothetical protein VFH50_12060 [Acidimicrobiales bacterium]|nr:hypothetical protein [Acidimicrobiales bacterium]